MNDESIRKHECDEWKGDGVAFFTRKRWRHWWISKWLKIDGKKRAKKSFHNFASCLNVSRLHKCKKIQTNKLSLSHTHTLSLSFSFSLSLSISLSLSHSLSLSIYLSIYLSLSLTLSHTSIFPSLYFSQSSPPLPISFCLKSKRSQKQGLWNRGWKGMDIIGSRKMAFCIFRFSSLSLLCKFTTYCLTQSEGICSSQKSLNSATHFFFFFAKSFFSVVKCCYWW